MKSRSSNLAPFLMWSIPLLFFGYQFILRIFPGLLMDQIMIRFSIDAEEFGKFAALYYYGYAGMQIPMAIALDKFGSRSVISASAVICGISAMVFSYSENWNLVCWSRFLIGAASAAGFLGISKVVSEWFAKEQYSKMIGLSFTIGIFGFIYGGRPVSALIGKYGWQDVSEILSACSVFIGLLAFIILRAPKTSTEGKSLSPEFKLSHFKEIFSSLTFLLLAIANFLMVGALEGFGDIWGISYLMRAYEMTKENAAQAISFLFIGMVVGGPLLVMCSKKIGDYMSIIFCGLGIASAFVLLLSNVSLDELSISVVCFVIGILCCYQVIVFSIGAKISKPEIMGFSIAFLNCVNMLGGSFFHTLIGKILNNLSSSNIGVDASKIYDIESYKMALSVIPLSAIAGVMIMLYIKIKK